MTNYFMYNSYQDNLPKYNLPVVLPEYTLHTIEHRIFHEIWIN